MPPRVHLLSVFILLSCLSFSAVANKSFNKLSVDSDQVKQWNDFVTHLYQMHLSLTRNNHFYIKEETGGYGGTLSDNKFYKEISYYQKSNDLLLSRIQWEQKHPNLIHSIEVYLYDKQERVSSDYYARFLPHGRNAPIQTLINLHNYDDQLHAFRQFDASGQLIYETCRGQYFNTDINIHLDDEEIVNFRTENDDELLIEAYNSCFMNVPANAGEHLQPLQLVEKTSLLLYDNSDKQINKLNQLIWNDTDNALLYVQRGNLHFKFNQFSHAVADYNQALQLDPTLITAYFGRGMAKARNGDIRPGIKDLSIYIKHYPNDSVAYTKRGVRYIWLGELKQAKQDLLRAIKLDATNAEAHDDLGVIYAHQNEYKKALSHFNYAIQYDPSYQKAYHNQAMIYFITGNHQHALQSINTALAIDAKTKTSLLLKSEILSALGKDHEASVVLKKAEFLPDGNWSERFPLQK